MNYNITLPPVPQFKSFKDYSMNLAYCVTDSWTLLYSGFLLHSTNQHGCIRIKDNYAINESIWWRLITMVKLSNDVKYYKERRAQLATYLRLITWLHYGSARIWIYPISLKAIWGGYANWKVCFSNSAKQCVLSYVWECSLNSSRILQCAIVNVYPYQYYYPIQLYIIMCLYIH